MTQIGPCAYGGGHTIAWTSTGSFLEMLPEFYVCSRCHSIVAVGKVFLEEVRLGLQDAEAGRWVEDTDLEEGAKL